MCLIKGAAFTSWPQHPHGPPPLPPSPALSSANQLQRSYWIDLHSISQFVLVSPFSPGSGFPHLSPHHVPQPKLTQSESQNVVFRPATSLGNLLEVQILRSLSRPPESEILGVEPRDSGLTSPPGNSDTCSVRTIALTILPFVKFSSQPQLFYLPLLDSFQSTDMIISLSRVNTFNPSLCLYQ